jgi:hypothetical protein
VVVILIASDRVSAGRDSRGSTPQHATSFAIWMNYEQRISSHLEIFSRGQF